MDDIQSFALTVQKDESMDPYSGFSDSEKLDNYMEIVNTLKFLDSGGRVTEDWMERHKWVIQRWRDWVFDYSEVNREVEEKVFRKTCNETETLISYLVQSIRTTKTFDVKVYYILLTKMKYICDNIIHADELEMLMSRMNMS